MATPYHKNPAQGVTKFTIFVDLSLVITSLNFLSLIYAWMLRRNNAFSLYITYMVTPMTNHKNPCPTCHEIYNFGITFLGYHYYTLSLSESCLEVEKKIFKEIMHFHSMTYIATLQHNNPCPGDHEIYKFGRPLLLYP